MVFLIRRTMNDGYTARLDRHDNLVLESAAVSSENPNYCESRNIHWASFVLWPVNLV